MKPGGSMLHSQGLSDNPYPELHPLSHTDNYFFKILYNNDLYRLIGFGYCSEDGSCQYFLIVTVQEPLEIVESDHREYIIIPVIIHTVLRIGTVALKYYISECSFFFMMQYKKTFDSSLSFE